MINSNKHTIWERWTRCTMGFHPSPYQCIQGVLYIRGDPLDPGNIFRFNTVLLSLPGSSNYNPSKPWVMKWRTFENLQACNMFIYVDDCQSSGPMADECWLTSCRIGSLLNHLGNQDAPRKRHFHPVRRHGVESATRHLTNPCFLSLNLKTKMGRWFQWSRPSNVTSVTLSICLAASLCQASLLMWECWNVSGGLT